MTGSNHNDATTQGADSHYDAHSDGASAPGKTNDSQNASERKRGRIELGPHGESVQDKALPLPMPLLLATILVVAGVVAWTINAGQEAPPMLVKQSANELADMRLKTARSTPAAATALSESFVPADSELRTRVLQRLAEFRAKWRIDGPIVAIHAYDVQGDAIELAAQFESWLDQNNLVTVNTRSSDAADGGDIVDTDLPAPGISGLLLRYHEEDAAIAGDLALALAPAIGGQVNLLSDGRVEEQRIVMSIVGAPAFGADGRAFFPH